jgi:peptide chain release factor 1
VRTMFDRLEATEQRYDDLTADLARPEISADYGKLQALARERASIEQIVMLYRDWKANAKALADARAMLEKAIVVGDVPGVAPKLIEEMIG